MRHPPNPTVGTGGFVKPGAVVTPVPRAVNAPRMINFTGVPEGMGGNEYYGRGIAGIEQARQDLAKAAGFPLSQVQEPFGGAAYMVDKLGTNLRDSMAQRAEAATRERLAAIMGGIDMTKGPTNQQIQDAYAADPAFGEKLYAQAVAAQGKEHWIQLPDGRQQNSVTGEVKDAGSNAAGPKLSDVNSFVGRIVGMPSYKNLAQSQGAWTQMAGAYERNTAQADLSMVIALAKLYDPDSVVREGEVETVKKTGNLPADVWGQWLYLTGQKGSRLDPEVRKGMLQEGFSKIRGFEQAWQKDRAFYLDQAARYGFDARDVPDFGAVTEPDFTKPAPGQPEEATTDVPAATPPDQPAPDQPPADGLPTLDPYKNASDWDVYDKLPNGAKYRLKGDPTVHVKGAGGPTK